ncbi:response regulator transcription factor [Enterobacter sp. UPMP2060]
MTVSNSFFSDDSFFVYGLCGLLSREFLNDFFIIFDFDCRNLYEDRIPFSEDKKVVAFVSNDIAFYKAENFGLHHVLDKKSSLKDILDFFLLERNSGAYKTKRSLSKREKEILMLMSDGTTHKEMVDKLGINYKTLYTHRRNLMLKLGCENRICLQNLFLK